MIYRRFKNMVNYSPEEYVEWMRQILEQDIPILNNDGERLMIEDGDVFRQAYDPNDPPRSILPAWWFVSRKGDVVDLSYPEEPEWRKKYEKPESRSFFYRFPIVNNGVINYKNMELHNLVGLVFDSDRFGRADALFKGKGLDAIGRIDSQTITVNGHHMDEDKANNDSSNIQFVTTPVHILFSKIPKPGASDEANIKFTQEFSTLMEEEAPGEITMLIDSPVKTVMTLERDSRIVQDIKSLLDKTIFVATPVKSEKREE